MASETTSKKKILEGYLHYDHHYGSCDEYRITEGPEEGSPVIDYLTFLPENVIFAGKKVRITIEVLPDGE